VARFASGMYSRLVVVKSGARRASRWRSLGRCCGRQSRLGILGHGAGTVSRTARKVDSAAKVCFGAAGGLALALLRWPAGREGPAQGRARRGVAWPLRARAFATPRASSSRNSATAAAGTPGPTAFPAWPGNRQADEHRDLAIVRALSAADPDLFRHPFAVLSSDVALPPDGRRGSVRAAAVHQLRRVPAGGRRERPERRPVRDVARELLARILRRES